MNDSEVLNDISVFINSVQNLPVIFKATSAVVVYWRDLCPYEDEECINVKEFANMMLQKKIYSAIGLVEAYKDACLHVFALYINPNVSIE